MRFSSPENREINRVALENKSGLPKQAVVANALDDGADFQRDFSNRLG
jgi:hypothetical protein